MNYTPQGNHCDHSIPIRELKRMARGRWREILQSAGIPPELLADRRGRPCPKCGGRDRFAALKDLEIVGAVHCRHCFSSSTNPKPGDGIASLQWWLGVSTADAIQWLRFFLGLGNYKHLPIQAIRSPLAAPPKVVQSESDRLRIELMAEVCLRNMTDASREYTAQKLGVHPHALRRLQVGWCPSNCATTWPMRDANGSIIGLRLRDPNTGSKKSVQGSAAGLFYDPDRFANISSGVRVWVAEGASDTAALLSVGFDAVGVPSAKSGGDQLLELGRRILPSEIVIVADGDGAGVESASLLRSELVILAGIRTIQPPNGIKDVREWINQGASRVDLEREAIAATVFTLNWTIGGGAA